MTAGDRVSARRAAEAERTLLGAILLGGAPAYAEIAELVNERHLVEARHRTIFGAVRALAARGRPIDGTTVAAELDRTGNLADAGLDYVAELPASTLSARNIRNYAQIVVDYASRGDGIDVPADDGGDDVSRRPSVATQLIELAERQYTLGVTPGGEAYGVPRAGPRIVALLRGARTSLRAELAREYYRATGRAAPASALADALLALEGAAHEADPVDLAVRVAAADAHMYIDLGDATARAIRVTPAGWSVVDDAPMLFRRAATTGPLPEPARGGSIDELWRHIRVETPDRPLVVAWLVAAMLADIPHPILALAGEHGAAKTTSMRMLAALVDPSPAATRKPPRDADAWITGVAASWVVALDNVSTVPDWLSDALCRAVTGDGDVRRRLYADRELEVFSFRRAICVSAIDLGALRGDLADRMLPIELTRIQESERRAESAISGAWAAAYPRILGGLLDVAARVLAELPDVELELMPRMADYARVLAAVDRALGTNGLDHYAGRVRAIVADSVSSDPLGAAIAERIVVPWEGTAADLLRKLEPERPPRGWPSSARAVTARLRRLAPGLRAAGWTVDDLGRTGPRHVVTWNLNPPAGTTERWSASDARDARDARESHTYAAGAAGDGSGVTGGVARTPADARTPHARKASTGAGSGVTGVTGDEYGAPLLTPADGMLEL